MKFAIGFSAAVCWLFGVGLDANAGTPKDFGALGNVVTLHTCGITTGKATLTCSGANFLVGDVGKAIVVSTAGTAASPQNNALVTTIAEFTNATTVRLNANAINTAANALTYYGTDDTAAIRSCVNAGTLVSGHCTISDGVTFMMSNTDSTISIAGARFRPGGLINGAGTIVFAPQGLLAGGVNDRLFYLASTEAFNPKQVGASISKGATSFTCFASADCALLTPGDWVILTEKDPTATDVVFADWARVNSVVGTTVKVATPFRMAFPNARAFNNSGTPAVCIAASPCGLSFRKVSNVVQNVTIRDINVIIPQVVNGNTAASFGTRDTRGITVVNTTVNSAVGQPFFSYLDQGLSFTNNVANYGLLPPEFASQVDFVISRNHWNSVSRPLFGTTTVPGNSGPDLDFGSGFGTFSYNAVGPSVNAGLETFYGLHDSMILGNILGWIHSNPGSCVALQGAYRVLVFGNVCAGSDHGYGVVVADAALAVNINSDSNEIWNNSMNGFALAPVACTGSLNTDNCFDPSPMALPLK